MVKVQAVSFYWALLCFGDHSLKLVSVADFPKIVVVCLKLLS